MCTLCFRGMEYLGDMLSLLRGRAQPACQGWFQQAREVYPAVLLTLHSKYTCKPSSRRMQLSTYTLTKVMLVLLGCDLFSGLIATTAAHKWSVRRCNLAAKHRCAKLAVTNDGCWAIQLMPRWSGNDWFLLTQVSVMFLLCLRDTAKSNMSACKHAAPVGCL